MKLITRCVMLLAGLCIMSFGIALSIKATLGTTPISCVPTVLSMIFPYTVGTLTIIFNVLLILFQIILLRKITISQISQMLVCIIFGHMINYFLVLIYFLNPTDYITQWIVCIASCFVTYFGLLLEVKADLTMLPGDGAVQAIFKVADIDFSKIKPFFDIAFVTTGVALSLFYLGHF